MYNSVLYFTKIKIFSRLCGEHFYPDWAINHIQKLYRIETAIKDKTPEEKQAIRQQQSHPLLAQFKVWLDDESALHVPPKSAIGKAIAYSLGQWPKLNRYIPGTWR